MIKKNIEIKINSKTRQVFFDDNFLGIQGENLQGYLIFKFEDEFVDGVPIVKVEQNGEAYNIYEVIKENDTYKMIIKSSLLKSDIIYLALHITENGSETEIPVFISKKFHMYVGDTIETTKTIPDEYVAWIDIANQKISEIDNLNIEMQNSIVTITRKDGTKYSENVKGEPGVQGKPGSIKTIPVNEFPTENIQEDAIYILPNPKPTNEKDKYLEYVYINGGWELFGGGSVGVDLTDYAKKTDIPDVSNFITKDVSDLSNYYNKTEIDTMVGDIETLLSEV